MSGAEVPVIFGAIASIITIIGTTKKVFDAAANTNGLPEAFSKVAGRLPIIEEILNSTKQRIEERKLNNDSCEGVKLVVKACEEKAKRLEALVHNAIPTEGASDMKRYYKAVKTVGKGSKVENLMQGMLEDLQLLDCEHGVKTTTKAQQEQIIKAIAEIAAVAPSIPEQEDQKTGFMNTNSGPGTQNNAQGENVAQGNGKVFHNTGPMTFGGIHNNIQNISNSLGPNEDEAQACLSALFLTDPSMDRADLMSKNGPRVDGTCQWIKSHAHYDSWLRSHSQLLWLSGGPGKGKTMLSIFLAEELEETARTQKKLFLQYFCDNKDEKRNTAVAVLRVLIYQLLQLRPKLFDHILPDFIIQKTSLFSFETLWRIFETMVCDPALETTYCVLDGLDECDEASLEKFLRKFASLFSANTVEPSACHLNLLIFSRGLPDFIPNVLSSFPRISLDPDASAEVNKDIDIFIQAKVEELSRGRRYSENLRVYVAEVFQIRAQGTFLWIGIVAKELGKLEVSEVEEALKTFPPGLDELYARILLQINSGRQKIAAMILRWVVMAVRPLTLSELSFAIEPTVQASTVTIDRDKRIRDQVSFCGHFLVIKDYRDYREDVKEAEEERDAEGEIEWVRVGLIHQSAKDYLLRKTQDSNPVLEYFRIKEDVANQEIAKTCLELLQSGFIDVKNPRLKELLRGRGHLRGFPLLSYAALEWPEHAKSLAHTDDLFDLSLPFYQSKSHIRTSWLEAYWNHSLIYENLEAPKSFPLLHWASFLGILPLVEKLVLGEGWINKIKPLRFLNKMDSYKMTALMWAARRGHDAIVRLLLEKGANTKIKNKDQETALKIAVEHDYEVIVQSLLEKGANVNTKDRSKATPLIKAAEKGHEAIIQLLLKKGANKEAQDINGETALMRAVRSKQKAVIQLLLEQGADVKVQDKLGETALIQAAELGQRAITQLLLERGADINAKDNSGKTALMQAATSGQKAVTQLLLEQGADVEVQDENGGTALMKAARGRLGGSEAVIRLLLERGADINAKDNSGKTALMQAATFGRRAVTQLLLEQGADINAKDKWRETALIKAAGSRSKNSEAIIRLLLENGADINAENHDGATALAIAVRKREEAEDGSFMRLFFYCDSESEVKELVEERKSNLDSVIQMLTLHSQT